MNTLQLLIFFSFTSFVGILTYLKTRNSNLKTEDGYFLGGRTLSGLVIAGSLMLTNISAGTFVGMSAQAYSFNMSVIGWEVGSAFALIIVALFLVPRYLRGAIFTIPDFLEERFDRGTKLFVSYIFILAAIFNLMPITLYAGAITMSQLFKLDEFFNLDYFTTIVLTVWALGIIGSFYAIFGGLKSVAISDTINGIFLLIITPIIPILALIKLGNGSFFQGWQKVVLNTPEKLNAIGSNSDPLPFATLFTGMFLVNLYYWGTDQSIIQRVLGSKSLAEGQKGVLFAGFFKILTPLIAVIPGVIAFNLYGNLDINPDLIYPKLVENVLPIPLIGIFAGVMFGAILSTFNSTLNSTTTLYMLNIYKRRVEEQEERVVSRGKFFGTFFSIVSIIIAPFIMYSPSGLWDYLQKISGLTNVPIFTVVLLGYLTKRVPAIAAKTSLSVFIFSYALLQFGLEIAKLFSISSYNFLFIVYFVLYLVLFILKLKNVISLLTLKILYLSYLISAILVFILIDLNLHFLHQLFIFFIFCSLKMLILGKIIPREKDYILEDKSRVDIKPWKYRFLASFFVFVIMILIYLVFSPLGLAA